MGRIFVSYSHKDPKEFAELRRFLEPLEKKGLIHFWDDNKIQPGDNWRQVIDAALADATVAVLLISQDFLNSPFISENELPYLLEKHAAGRLKLLPVFLKASNVEFVDPILADIQGYGSPDAPVTGLGKGEREALYVKLSKQLAKLADQPLSPTPRNVRPTPPVEPPNREYALIAHFERRGDQVRIDYRRPGEDPFSHRDQPWNELQQSMAPLLRILDSGDRNKIRGLVDTASDHWGGVLFGLLFGTDAALIDSILRAAFWRPTPHAQPTPVFAPLRLRITGNIPELLGLPWRLTCWDHRALIENGWIFLTGQEPDPRHDIVTSAPCPVLLIEPDGGENADVAALLRQSLLALWPKSEPYVRLARESKQIANALAGQSPHFVFVHAPAMKRGERLELQLADGPLPFQRLAEMLRAHSPEPAMLYLDVPGCTVTDLAPLFDLSIALIVWPRQSHANADPMALPLAWLDAWLRLGKDPVAALHQVCKGETSALPIEAHTVALRANYRHWRTDVRAENLRERLTHLRLDREKQKGVTAKWLTELIASDRLRVMTLVPYGAAGNRLAEAHQQLCEHAHAALDSRAAIKQVVLQFPECRDKLHADLEHELKHQLGLDFAIGETVGQLLKRRAPGYQAGRRSVLWLHWGLFGEGDGCQPSLRKTELNDWLAFTGHFLTFNCPDQIRLVCSLAIQTSKLEAIRKALTDKHRELGESRFWLRILEPIGQVEEHELLDFLKDHSDGCPATLCAELSRLLTQETGGRFESLVELIEPAEQSGNWHALLEKLRKKHTTASKQDDDETF